VIEIVTRTDGDVLDKGGRKTELRDKSFVQPGLYLNVPNKISMSRQLL
jgi:hypothetical protein